MTALQIVQRVVLEAVFVFAALYILAATVGPTLGWQEPQPDTWVFGFLVYMPLRGAYIAFTQKAEVQEEEE